jgi:hypothetical protein|tara:strand:+ start:3373 stop:4899 length:1527 start_codon:yes stop_codon:yes gene_type:complete
MNKKESILRIKNFNFPIIEISILVIIALSLRFFFFESEIPLSLDALTYFSFSYETKILGHFPEVIPFTNLGWAWILTFFFNIFSFDSAIEYMNLQKIISVILSSLTIIPVYLLCKKFSERKYALFASSLLVFDPRIIQNSLLGITDALYLLMMTFVFVLFFNIQKKYIYAAFGLTALTTIVRAEGVFLFIAISILFFIKFKNEEKIIIKYLVGFAIFILILSPILLERVEIFQNEFMVQSFDESGIIINSQQNLTSKIIIGFENFIKLLGWVTIPIYLVFLVPGFFIMLKKWKKKNLEIIIPIIIMSIPIFYAYFIPAQDTRYLFVLFPFFSIISVFSITVLGKRIQSIRKILPVILIIVIMTSAVFFYEKTDSVHEKEAYLISKYLVDNTQGVNSIYPETKFIRSSEVVRDFPDIPYKENGEFTIKIKNFNIHEENLFEFIKNYKNKGLSHIITDENLNRNSILVDIFNNEQNYPFLEKTLDSKELNWEHHFKIFKINYKEFEKFKQ